MTEAAPAKKSLKQTVLGAAVVAGLIGGVIAFAVVPGIVDDAHDERVTALNVTEVGHPVEIVKVKKRKGLTKRYVRYEYTVAGEDHSALGDQVNIGATLRFLPDLIVYYDPESPEDGVVSTEAVEGTGGVQLDSKLLDEDWGPNFDEMPTTEFVVPDTGN
jgi:hypothetical protein